MKTVSVIIPMYNSERHIQQCIQSVLSQTYPSLEILIINDGSTDSSMKLCQELRNTDNRIQIFSQKNKGASSARNYALDIASGEYIFFLDSDDAIHPLLIEESVKQAERLGAELVLCSLLEQSTQQLKNALEKASENDKRPPCQVVEGRELDQWFHIKNVHDLSRVGGVNIRRDCIGKLRFEENVTWGEDTLFMYHICSQQIRMVYLDIGWYYYRVNPESMTRSVTIENAKCYYKCIQKIRDSEFQKDNFYFALSWERLFLDVAEIACTKIKEADDESGFNALKREAVEEMKSPLFKELALRRRILFFSCFFFSPVYFFLSRLRPFYRKIKEKRQ